MEDCLTLRFENDVNMKGSMSENQDGCVFLLDPGVENVCLRVLHMLDV